MPWQDWATEEKKPPAPKWPYPPGFNQPTERREVVWDRGMPQEMREQIYEDDPRWPTAEKI